MIPSNFRIEILAIRTLLCALGIKGLIHIVSQGSYRNTTCNTSGRIYIYIFLRFFFLLTCGMRRSLWSHSLSFQLSDVTAGGSTVFTRLGIRIQPEKGMALQWYNLLSDGDPDLLTYHAACPVLHGSKWITTKWIHYDNQWKSHPCPTTKGQRFDTP